MGAGFPLGMFVAQDDANDIGNQKFKLVPWEDVADALVPPLVVDPVFDARPVPEPVAMRGLLALAVIAALRQRRSRG